MVLRKPWILKKEASDDLGALGHIVIFGDEPDWVQGGFLEVFHCIRAHFSIKTFSRVVGKDAFKLRRSQGVVFDPCFNSSNDGFPVKSRIFLSSPWKKYSSMKTFFVASSAWTIILAMRGG